MDDSKIIAVCKAMDRLISDLDLITDRSDVGTSFVVRYNGNDSHWEWAEL